MRVIISSFIIFVLLLACGPSKTKVTPEQIQQLQELVDSKDFEIKSTMAYPQVTQATNRLTNTGIVQPGSNVNQIDLTGNPNYVRIKGDSIYAELPYFGERQQNFTYNGKDDMIIVADLYTNYETSKNEKNGSITVSLRAHTKTESLRFNIKVFPNLKTTTKVVGSTRFPISYNGEMSSL